LKKENITLEELLKEAEKFKVYKVVELTAEQKKFLKFCIAGDRKIPKTKILQLWNKKWMKITYEQLKTIISKNEEELNGA